MNLSTSVLEKFSHLSFHYHSLLLSQFSIFCTKVVIIDPIPRVLDFLTDGIFSQHRHNTCLSFQIEPSFGDLQTTALLETFHPHPCKSFPEQWHGLTSTMKNACIAKLVQAVISQTHLICKGFTPKRKTNCQFLLPA